MTEQPAGPLCGNNPNVRLKPGDRKAVEDFKGRLALQKSAKPYVDRAAWVDGDPLMEVIAATVWKHCARDDEDMPQVVCDDPRTIAAFAAAVARAHAAAVQPPAGRDAVEPVCVCGHPVRLHHEDVCLLAGCGCADCLEISALPEALESVLTKRFTELGNPFSEMRRHEQGPDGWPASHPVGPRGVAEVLRELLRRLADEAQQPGERSTSWTPGPVAVTQAADAARDASPTAVLLASRCDSCQHTLNWHRNDTGCTVVLCVCGRFQPPAEEAHR